MRCLIRFVIACFCGTLAAAATTSSEKPNIIVIMADDLGYADMSFMPKSPADVHTPGIDSLRTSGIYFSNAYSTAPICSPSRVGFMTGRYQQRWGNFWYGQGGLPLDERTIAQALKALGYKTSKIGKVHTNGGPAEHPLDHGFDEFMGFIHHTHDYIRLSDKDAAAYNAKGENAATSATIGPLVRGRDELASYENGFTTDIFTDEAVNFINQNHAQPFYLQIEHNAVHMPTYVTHPRYARLVGLDVAAWDRDAATWEFPYWDPAVEPWKQWHSKWGHLGEVDPLGRKRYLSHLIALDHSVSRIMNALQATGIDKETVVVFLSDNGGTINTYANNAPLSGYKYMFGEGGIRIPMLIKLPDAQPVASSIDQMVSAMDLYPTLIELAGGEIAGNLDGKSLLPLIHGRAFQHHEILFWAQGKSDTWVARMGKWKLTHNAGWIHENYSLDEEGRAVRAPDYVYPNGICLYDLEQDISEAENLAREYPQIVAEITRQYQRWRSSMSRPLGRSEHVRFTRDIGKD